VPDAQADAGAALFVTIARLCRPGRDRLDPRFTCRLHGAPASEQARLFRLAAYPRMAAVRARSRRCSPCPPCATRRLQARA